MSKFINYVWENFIMQHIENSVIYILCIYIYPLTLSPQKD